MGSKNTRNTRLQVGTFFTQLTKSGSQKIPRQSGWRNGTLEWYTVFLFKVIWIVFASLC